MDRRHSFRFNRTALINRLTDNIHDTAESFRAHRHCDRCLKVSNSLTANKTFSRVHRNGADCVLSQMLSDFENQSVALVICF